MKSNFLAFAAAALGGMAQAEPSPHHVAYLRDLEDRVHRERAYLTKGDRRFRKQAKAHAANMASRGGALDARNISTYRATVQSQQGFTTRQLEELRKLWVADKRAPFVLLQTPWMRDVDWGNYLRQTRAAWTAWQAAHADPYATRWPRLSPAGWVR